MEGGATRRNSWLACPNCGHKVGRARTCDVEFKCKYCGHEFEVIIRSLPASRVPSSSKPSPNRQRLGVLSARTNISAHPATAA